MELRFEWNEKREQLDISPDPGVATRDAQKKYSAAMRAILEGTQAERDVALYQMAELTYDLRDWYQPVTEVPGGAMPHWLLNPEPSTYTGVRSGIHQLNAAGSMQQMVKLLERSDEAQRAARFLNYVRRVTACECHNEAACMPLLMALATFKKLNPEGDSNRITMLKKLLQHWYRIDDAAEDATERRKQASRAAFNYRWLSPGWRAVWVSP